MSQIATNIAKVNHRIQQAAAQAGRHMTDITLCAVSKKQPTSAIAAAYQDAGQRHFGENYAQELAAKYLILNEQQGLPLVWHFIGPIQSNKCALINHYSDWVHGIDRLKTAEKLHMERTKTLASNQHHQRLNVCIQVNIDGEASKSGVAIDSVDSLAAAIIALPALQLRGLMAIPDPTQTAEHTAIQYQRLQHALAALAAAYPAERLDTLSYGMSGDLELAITNGATLVRIGTDIFGQRL